MPASEDRPTAITDAWEGDLVVFLIGMRINAWWRIDLWLPVLRSMGRMLAQLRARPELGLLGFAPTGFSNPVVLVQYWRSLEHLERFAASRDLAHVPAWSEFNRRTRATNAVGVWHETFVVKAGAHESIYVNMPAFGLAAAAGARPATGSRSTARGRLGDHGPAGDRTKE
jgi:hypothetical protein